VASQRPQAMDLFSRQRLGQAFIMGLLVLVLYGVYRVLEPYLHTFILASLLASLCYPLHARLLKRWPKRPTLAALSSTVLVALVVLVPLGIFGTMVAVRGMDTFETVQHYVKDGKLTQLLESERAQSFLASRPVTMAREYLGSKVEFSLTPERLSELVLKYAQAPLGWLAGQALPLLGNSLALVINFGFLLFLLFYLFRDGPVMGRWLLSHLPLAPAHEVLLLDRITRVSRSAVLGTLATAIAQGSLAMVGFGISGIPWFVYGVLLGFASFIPIVGTALVWIPCVGYLLIVGKVGLAIFLTIWCVLAVGLADNLLRPWLMEGDTGISSVVLFFGILGGINLFGLIGVIYGPLLLGLAAVLLYIVDLESHRSQASSEGLEPPPRERDQPPPRRPWRDRPPRRGPPRHPPRSS
jgi:predicted PurR-regulated permease PerM